MRKPRPMIVAALLLVTPIVCSPLFLGAQSSGGGSGSRITLEVTWKLDARGRGAAAGIFAHIEALEHYEVAGSCYDNKPGGLELLRERNNFPICLRYLDGHFLRAEGDIGVSPKPIYAYIGAPKSDPPIITGKFEKSPDGGVQILIKTYEQNISTVNGSAEDSLGCAPDNYPLPKISYDDFQSIQTLDRTWDSKAVRDPARLESCEPGNVSIRIHVTCESKGLQLFQAMIPVFTHPRCINCHGVVNPVTGANHEGGAVGDTACLDCHTAGVTKNSSGQETSPWRLAPSQFSFVGKDVKALCEQVREFGFPDPEASEQLSGHVEFDPLIGLGFEGLRGGAALDDKPHPPPMSRAQFVELVRRWAVDGNHACSCLEEMKKP